MNFERLYEYRFQHVDQASRQRVWDEIAQFVYAQTGRPDRVLDPAAGRCEFINAVPARERWAVDAVDYAAAWASEDVKLVVSDIFEAELPPDHFDLIWVSNFLEHLANQEQVAEFLEQMYARTRPGGRIAVMGPNFRHCADEYFDCADHNVLLTQVGAAEHIYAAGFEIERIESRFFPYTFRSRYPASPRLVRWYLRCIPAWKMLGKQFLVIGRRPTNAGD